MAAANSVKVVIAGQTYNLTFNSTSGKWEGTVTAPNISSYNQSGHYYDVAVTATDLAGNSDTANSSHATLGSNLRLQVKEKVLPTVVFVSPSAGAFLTTSKPAISLRLRDDDSGINLSTLQLKVDENAIAYNATGVTSTPATGGYDVTYTPQTALAEGQHTITCSVTDNDGNVSTVASISFKIDTVPPTLNISEPANDAVTNSVLCKVSGTTNDATSSPVTINVKLNGVDQGAVPVNEGGAFTKAVTLTEGVNTIVVTATDSAGKVSTITRTVTLDTQKPIFTAVEITPNPVDAGKTYTIKVTLQ